MQTYDLTIHLDEDGDPILEGTTKAGEAYTKTIRGNLTGDLVIGCTAEEFMERVPKHLVVGMQGADGEMQKLCPPLLH